MLSSITTRRGASSISQFISFTSTKICNTSNTASTKLIPTSVVKNNTMQSLPRRHFATTKKVISVEERAALRKARKERTASQQAQLAQAEASKSSSTSSSSTASSPSTLRTIKQTDPRLVFGLGLGIPTLLLAWGVFDENSPPAKFASYLGLDDVVESYAKPAHEKLLPNWNDMPNVPKDLNPMTLVIDLENTLVNSSWDRKHGWRTAKRPGAVKLLRELAQYYEIVVFTPSHEGLGAPIMDALQNESGAAIMHYLFRDACYYKEGSYMKDLSKLNRNISRVILIDDDAKAAALNPDNLIRVKPYTDPKDRNDNTLERLIPFLVEIATENYNDVRVVLGQFKGMDADEIVDVLDDRVSRLQSVRNNRRGLGSWSNAGKMDLPVPEMTPVDRNRRKGGSGISSKDLVGGQSAPSSSENQQGFSGWLQKRQEKQAQEKMEKMEQWNRLMMERQEKQQREVSSN